jgi:hypothetical protein
MLTPMTDCTQPVTETAERRLSERQTMVLRVGVLVDAKRATFCLVTNISRDGVRVRVFSPLNRYSEVQLTVGDDDPITGQVAWVQGQEAGIKFQEKLDTQRLLRATQKAAAIRRRSSPRINVIARAILRTHGQVFAGELANISTTGAEVRTSAILGEGRPASLVLPDMTTIPAFVRWCEGGRLGLAFQAAVPARTLTSWLAGRLRVSAGT